MFEIKQDFDYEVYDKQINPDSNTWNRYDTVLKNNSNDLLEIQIDMSDVILSGTLDSVEKMPVIIPRFQVMFDDVNFQIDMI